MAFDLTRFTAVKSIFDIDTHAMRDRGVAVFCFDIENTLGPMGLTEISPRVFTRLCRIQDQGFGICFGTNSLRQLWHIAEPFHHRKPDGMVPFVMQPTASILPFGIRKSPKKPDPKFFAEIVRRTQHPDPSRIAMVGDKFGADVLGAIDAGMHGILVNPLGPDLRKEWLARIRQKDEELLATFRLQRAA